MNVNFVLFEDFETLDALGPAEMFGCVEEYTLKFFSREGGLIRSKQGAVLHTEPFSELEPGNIVLIPGGLGTRKLLPDADYMAALRQIAEESAYCLTVCTGSALLGKTGLLDGKTATSNKAVMEWVKSINPAVNWADSARWRVDGKFYTSSGVSAGIDTALAFIAEQKGQEKAEAIARYAEYVWNRDMDNDPFAIA